MSSDAPAEPRGPLLNGTPAQFGRYETWRVLGSGAFGRVYLARDSLMERYVAIKAPKDPLPTDKHRAFLREARAVAEVHHPNICPVFDVGVEGELPFLVMRYVGGTLADLIEREPPNPTQSLQFVQQIAEALEAVHEHGIFHRDLKPANVLYDAKAKRLLLTDFGIARWADATNTFGQASGGTPFYMAPEQWEPGKTFGPISARTDVYALGVMLFEFLTGERLFPVPPGAEGLGALLAMMDQHRDEPPRAPSAVCPLLDRRLDDICLRALAKRPDDRYASAKEFARAVADYLRPVPPPVVAAPPPPPPRVVSLPPVVAPPRVRRPGEEVEFPLPGGLNMVFCWIPPGECQLGSPETEHGRDADEDEETRGRFRTDGFWLGKYPVTQAEWAALAGRNPSWFCASGDGAAKVWGMDTSRFPVEQVSWDDICNPNGFLNALNALSGVERVFGMHATFSLPHENMWEYACRGGLGNSRPFYWGSELNGTQANCDGTFPYGTTKKGPYLNRPSPVGTYAKLYPHPWGLCDLIGNVWEWCINSYKNTTNRILRGSAWYSDPGHCRTAYRYRDARGYRYNLYGFRVCLCLD